MLTSKSKLVAALRFVPFLLLVACVDDATSGLASTSAPPPDGGAPPTVAPPPPPPTPVPPPAVIPNPPVITTDVRDVTVVVGTTAVFSVVATGSGVLTYQWQQGAGTTFTDIVGETNPTLSLPSVTQAMTNVQYRVVVSGNGVGGPATATSRAATLSVFAVDQAADVFLQHPPNVVDRHPSLITATGAGYSGVAEMTTGFFHARADGNLSPAAFCYAGFLSPLTLVNNTGSAVVLPAGAIVVEVEGTYVHTAAPSRVAGAQIDSIAQADGDGALTSANARHQWSIAYDGVGNVSSTSNKFEGISLVAGGTATSTTSTITALKDTVTLGAMTIAPGKRMNIRYTLTVRAYDGTVADFSTIPAKIKVKLPAGVMLDRNTSVPLTWITN